MAERLLAARREGRTLDPLTDTEPLTLERAYRVQHAVTSRRVEAGQRVVGYKLGYTAQAMREQMGIAEPNSGPLTDAMLTRSGEPALPGLLQPRVEPEIGLRLRRRLTGPARVDEVLDACDAALACLEVVDSVFTGYRFRLEDNTADGSSAAQVVVGEELPLSGLDEVAVRLDRNGQPWGEATGAAAGGHPAAGVGWLAGQLAGRGEALEPGQLIITGGLTAAVPLEPGDEISATFSGRLTATIHRPPGMGLGSGPA